MMGMMTLELKQSSVGILALLFANCVNLGKLSIIIENFVLLLIK